MDAVLTSAQLAALLVLDGAEKPIDNWNKRSIDDPVRRVNGRAVDSLCDAGLAAAQLVSIGGIEFDLRFVITDKGRDVAAKIRESRAKAGR